MFKILAPERRNDLQRYLGEHGIGSAVHYAIPLHLQTVGQEPGYKAGDFPVSERQAQQMLSIPISQTLRSEEIEYVASTIRAFYQGVARRRRSPADSHTTPSGSARSVPVRDNDGCRCQHHPPGITAQPARRVGRP
jgi:hypothetical protein